MAVKVAELTEAMLRDFMVSDSASNIVAVESRIDRALSVAPSRRVYLHASSGAEFGKRPFAAVEVVVDRMVDPVEFDSLAARYLVSGWESVSVVDDTVDTEGARRVTVRLVPKSGDSTDASLSVRMDEMVRQANLLRSRR